MKTLNDFYQLKDAEDYFHFFDIDFDGHIVAVKRFHIMKEYGALVKKGFENYNGDEKYLMDFLKFALIRVYMDYKNGHAPSAAEVWGMLEDGKAKGCLACAISSQGEETVLASEEVVLHNTVMANLSGKDEERAKFFLGQKVKLLEDVKNDGTYPYLKIGEVMIKKGSVGYIRTIGEFLQVIRVYEVHFLDAEAVVEVIGCREHELEALEPYRDLEAEESEWMMNHYRNK